MVDKELSMFSSQMGWAVVPPDVMISAKLEMTCKYILRPSPDRGQPADTRGRPGGGEGRRGAPKSTDTPRKAASSKSTKAPKGASSKFTGSSSDKVARAIKAKYAALPSKPRAVVRPLFSEAQLDELRLQPPQPEEPATVEEQGEVIDLTEEGDEEEEQTGGVTEAE